MSAKTIRNALGLLQDDPDNAEAWNDLRGALGGGGGGGDEPPGELAKLLEAARRAHEMRREYDAVARLLEMEVTLARGTDAEADLVAELGRVLDDEVMDDTRAVAAWKRLQELRPGSSAEETIEKSEAKRAKWRELVSKYVDEAKKAKEAAFKSSLLVSASEAAYRYGRSELSGEGKKEQKKRAALVEEIVSGLREALTIDAKNRRAGLLLERVYREEGRWEELATTLEQLAGEVGAKEEKVAAYIRLARVFAKRLGSKERAAAAYERVLDLSPGHPEATSALVDHFTQREMWDHLVSLYEGQLATSPRGQELGMILQIAMVNWKMRGKPDAAEPYFERLRKFEPAHPGMLSFFREWCMARGETTRLAAILGDAQRSTPDGAEKKQIATEIAKLAEEGANATKAIEQWRALLRQDPTNQEARQALRRLYRASGGWNALADLLRSELERVPADDAAARLPILREIAGIYREHIKSDSALVTVLSQIIALDGGDTTAVRELARVYDSLGRWRDLLTTQTRLAELEKDAGAKAELYRAVARRWLDQFSNVQNAVEAYEKLHEAAPTDKEAIEKLRELYTKRRAYRQLYDLLGELGEQMEAGAARRELWIEMAKLAAERLDRGADAAKLYKRVLEEDPDAQLALDALEKQAERDKDWATVAEVLERRAGAAAGDDAARLNVLQKLGAVYSERLHDTKGSMSAWRRVLDLSPGHAKAMRVLRDAYVSLGDYDGLTTLYAETDDWEGLVEVLSGAADKTGDPALKVDLSFRSADIYTHKLNAPERAFRAYERVLGVRPDDARAASALVPLYEEDEKWARLPALYEVLLGHATDVDEQLVLLGKLANVTGKHLQDRPTAFAYARQAYELAPDRPDALETFEEAARAADDFEAFVATLEARLKGGKKKKGAPDSSRSPGARALKAKVAEVYAARLGRVDEAVKTLRALAVEDDKDEASVASLDKLLRDHDRREDLRWLFELRIERANTAARLDLFAEWATLEEEAFVAPDQAIAIYRRMLDVVPNHGGALRALSRLLKASGDAEGAAEILERDRDQREGEERAAREVELARLYMEALKRPVDALAAVKRALEIVPNGAEAVAVAEQLLGVGETRAAAATVLEQSYAETGDTVRQAEVLEVMIATAAARETRLALYNRLADVHERLEALETAFDVVARAAREYPTDLALWDRLGILANRTQRSQAFVEAIAQAVPTVGDTGLPASVELDLAERAATLYEEALGEIDRARPYLERILTRDPENERAFVRLKQILTTRESWTDLESLYERTVGVTSDPTRRAELLAEVALIAEEITGEPAKAISYYERILEIDPLHEQAIKALDSLYASEDRWPSLAKLLTQRLASASDDETVHLKLRLGTLHFTKLGDPKAALGDLEDVLSRDVGNRDARELVEKCLDVPELRARAAIVLEGVYAAKDEVRDLVRVLEIRLEFATEKHERRDLLARVAELRDERLTDDAGAFEAFARLVPIAPGDETARARMLEIARRLGVHERAAEVLTRAAAAADAPQPRGEILTDVARIYEDQLHDPTRAETVYAEVLALDPEEPSLALPAARSLERLYAAAGKSADLARILEVEVKLEGDADARRSLYARLGELCETVLEDPARAIGAWKQCVEEDPSDERALAALDRLYEKTGAWRALVDVLRARERLAADGTARKQILLRIATTLAEKLTDVPEAIVAYRTILDDFGAERASLAALATLYEIADRWPDLADALEGELALADAASDRLHLLARLGAVRLGKLDDVSGAIDAYRQALVLEPSHGPSRDALEALLASEAARRDAAAILRPLYEADGEHQRLLRVLDIEVEYTASIDGKLAIFAQAAQVAEGPLGDAGRAFAYAARGLREASGEAEFGQWLERAERLAATTSRFAELVDLLRAVVPDILDGDLQLDVTLRTAELARTKLGDRDLARTYYVKALDLRADERRALVALESLYEEAGDAPALLDVLKRRAETAENDDERKAILFKQARLCETKLEDRRAAIEVYEAILEIAFDDEAVSSLERLYTLTERWDDLMALYERQIGLPSTGDAKKASLHHALGQVLETRVKDFDRTFDAYEAALKIDPQHPATIASLEGLMEGRTHAFRAAEMLEGVYLARLDWRRVMATIEARLEATQDPDERRSLLRRLAKLHEEQEENYRASLDTTAKLLAEDVTDESTWAELERLARVANAEERLAEIYATELAKVTSDEPATARLARRTGELYEQLKETDKALVFYRRAYAFAPEEGKSSFDAIDRLLRGAGRAAERADLYRAALDYRDDARARIETLHAIAQIEEMELHDDVRASETYRAALDVDDTDATALESLARLYARRERWSDLADLTRKRAEQSALPDDEAKFRLELGKLQELRLEDPRAAIQEYQTVVEIMADPLAKGGPGVEAVRALEALLRVPAHQAKVVEILRPLYERADDWRNLVAVNEVRLGIAEDALEKVAILRESGRLWEERGADPNKAFDAVRAAFEIDPDDGDARGEMDRLGASTTRWDDLAAAYETGIGKTEGLGKRELLGALARLHDARRDDPRRALDAWERLFALDETELQPLEEMDALATLLSDWPTLVRVLAKKAELVGDDGERASTWRRIGEARRDMLDDAGGAIEAYERALELEPDSAFTIDNLIALYETKNDAARLVDLYRRRVELCGDEDGDLKYQLLVSAADRFEFGLNDRREAIAQLGEALLVKPADPIVTRRLDALYTAEGMWPELLENLRQQVALADGEAAARGIRKRIGALLAKELDDPGQALEAYRTVLDGGFDEDAMRAVREIGETRDDLRTDVADVLEPVLRGASRHADLADVLEMRLRAQTEPKERARTLRSIAQVAESWLADRRRAENALLRALVEEPEDAHLHDEIERVADQLGEATESGSGWANYADALAERAAATFDAQVTTDLFVRLGRVAEDRLKDDARAAKAFAQAAEQAGDTVPVLVALDRLLGRLGDAKGLADVLERRIALETEARGQAELMHRLATLQIEKFGEKNQGLSTLRSALEKVPEHEASRASIEALLADPILFDEAFDALEWAYRTLSRSEDLASLYERRVARADTVRDRARARLDLARVLEEQAKDPARAQRVVEAAVAEDPSDADALAELERLAGANGGWKDAAQALATALEFAKDLPSGTASELWVRLAHWQKERQGDAKAAEDAFARALLWDPESLDVLRALEELRRAPGRERDLVETLRRRAKLEGDPSTKRVLLREAKELAEGAVGDRALAEAALRDLLTDDEVDAWGLEELTRLRELAEDWNEVIALLLRRAENAHGDPLELKHKAAEVALEKLGDTARAMSLYEEILDQEPSDERAANKLAELYPRTGRDAELAKLITLLIDTASSPEVRSRHRLALARLQAQKFDAPHDAITTLHAILDEDPAHNEAVMLLSELLEKTGEHEELAELLHTQIERARERGDTSGELALQVCLGELFEGRLADTPRALDVYEEVLAREPSHVGALEAIARLSEGRGAWDRAEGALAKLLAATANGAGTGIALRLAAARERLGDLDGVEWALKRALDLEPTNTETRTRLRELYEKQRKWQDLADLLVGDANILQAANPDAAPLSGPISQPPQSARSLAVAAAAGTNPVTDQVRLLRRAAEIHVTERGEPNDAVPLLERATALAPQDRELLLMLCDAYTASKRERDAAQVLERVIASFGGKRTKELSVYHHRLGRALASLGDKDVALTQLDMAFKIDPGSVSVLKDLGVLALETNDLDRAQKTFRALLLQRLDPQSGISKGEVFYYLGEISAKQGDKAKAVQMLERAIENEPSLTRAKTMLTELKG